MDYKALIEDAITIISNGDAEEERVVTAMFDSIQEDVFGSEADTE